MIVAPRLIPVLLLSGKKFVKTVNFDGRTYLGDPINIVRIFNEKEVDELCLLDIDATSTGAGPNWEYIETIVSECFMPVSYGGGLTNVEDCRRAIAVGFEKVVLNSVLATNPELVARTADVLGSQAVVVSIDVRRSSSGSYEVFSHGANQALNVEPQSWARQMEKLGAGEIILNAVERDGTLQGYDLDLIRIVSENVGIPVVALGGARDIDDLSRAVIEAGASAVAAGSLFVFYGKRRAVLINPPTQEEFMALLLAKASAKSA